jgi:hypothetical protein
MKVEAGVEIVTTTTTTASEINEEGKEMSPDTTPAAVIITKVPTWDPSDYQVLVKSEFLVPAPQPVQKEKSDEKDQNKDQKKSNKRPRDHRPNGMEKLCGQSRKGEQCTFGDSCRFR